MLEQADTPVELNVSPEKVCFIIAKARAYDAKVEAVEPDPGSNPIDSADREILEDYPDDATGEELSSAIDQLTDEAIVDLIALAWLGRGDFDRASWSEARALALDRHRQPSSSYLMGMPALGDYLEEGLSELGYSCEAYELGRL
jgi:hypothetical protein